MANTSTGGPAFPSTWQGGDGVVYSEPGMSLRDYFATKAMEEALRHERDIRSSMIGPGYFRYDAVAHAAYVMANAMLRARSAGQE